MTVILMYDVFLIRNGDVCNMLEKELPVHTCAQNEQVHRCAQQRCFISGCICKSAKAENSGITKGKEE